MPSSNSKTRTLPGKLKFLTIGLIVGLAIGVAGTLFVQLHNPPDKPSSEPSVIFERIVSQNELVSVSQNYQIVDKATDSNKLFDMVEIPFTINSFWYRYAGTIKAGVNLEDATYRQIGNTIYVHISDPYIISNTPNMEKSGVLEENNNILNPIHVEDVDAFQRDCIETSEKEIVEDGLLNEARTNAENNIRNIFLAALGNEYIVEFE